MHNALLHTPEPAGRHRRLFDLLRSGEFVTKPMDIDTAGEPLFPAVEQRFTAPQPRLVEPQAPAQPERRAVDTRTDAPAALDHLQFLASESLIFRDR